MTNNLWARAAKLMRQFLGSMINYPADFFSGWYGFAPAESGVEVNELTAMQIAAFVGCVRVLSDAVATTPLMVYERTPDGDRLANEHPLASVLQLQPNPDASAFDLRQTGQGHVVTTGNCYLEIAFNGAGQPGGLYLRNPYRIQAYRYPNGQLFYKSNETPNGKERDIPAEDIVHVRGMGLDSIVGLSPVQFYCREVLGSDLAAQSYSSRFFANDSRPGGYLEAPNMMTPEKKLQAIQSWLGGHGRTQAHKMAILDGGLKWQKVGIDPEEAQFLQTREFNRSQIACIFGVPPHFLGEPAESRANMEQRALEFLSFTLRPWLTRWEMALNIKLFPTMGRNAGRYFCKFDTSQFERATYADLLRGIQMGRYATLITGNEGRRMLGLQAYTAKQMASTDAMDKLMKPVNMTFVTDNWEEEQEPAGGGADDGSQGQGGSDQTGGDQGGAPDSTTTQGGDRSVRIDPEFPYYSRIFYPQIRDAFRRVQVRKQATARDYQRVFSPVLIGLASALEFHDDGSLEIDPVLGEDSVLAIRVVIDGIYQRASAGAIDEATEWQRAFSAIKRAAAAKARAEEPTEDDDEDETPGPTNGLPVRTRLRP